MQFLHHNNMRARQDLQACSSTLFNFGKRCMRTRSKELKRLPVGCELRKLSQPLLPIRTQAVPSERHFRARHFAQLLGMLL